MTVDFMVVLIATEELDALNQYMVKQLKNRYKDMSHARRFVVGVDRAKMRLYDAEPDAQTLQSMDAPIMDKPKFNINKFEGIT
jgi:hypothetical protein